MNKTVSRFFFFVLLLTFSACGKKGGTARSRNTLPTGNLITGKLGALWQSSCMNADNTLNRIYEYRFYDTGFVYIEHVYDDADCKTLKYEIYLKTDAMLEETDKDTYRLNQRVENVFDAFLIPATAAFTKSMNDTRSCGLTNWTINQPQSLLNVTCPASEILTSTLTILHLSKDQRSLNVSTCKSKQSQPSSADLARGSILVPTQSVHCDAYVLNRLP